MKVRFLFFFLDIFDNKLVSGQSIGDDVEIANVQRDVMETEDIFADLLR